MRREDGPERFVDEEFHGLVARIGHRFRGGVSAEDAVQEALIRAWQRSASGEHIASWNGWVATVANNLESRLVVLDLYRHRDAEWRLRLTYQDEPPAAAAVEQRRQEILGAAAQVGLAVESVWVNPIFVQGPS